MPKLAGGDVPWQEYSATLGGTTVYFAAPQASSEYETAAGLTRVTNRPAGAVVVSAKEAVISGAIRRVKGATNSNTAGAKNWRHFINSANSGGVKGLVGKSIRSGINIKSASIPRAMVLRRP